MQIEEFLKTQKDYSLISKETPLVSNLNMLENIALIKEVHAFMSTSKAEALAAGLLEAIDLDYIGQNRVTSCSNTEIFYVMFMRSLMSDEKNIIIVTPYSILYDLRDFK